MSRDSEFKSLKKELQVVDLSEVTDKITCLSTGNVAFDLAMGGGWPEGRISEIYGEWQTGKSLIAYLSIAACQRAGGFAVLDDAERAFTKTWAKMLGINTDDLIYCYFDSLEDGFQHMEDVAKKVRDMESFKDAPLLYVKDSLAASIAKSEIDEPFEKGGVAVRARAISRGLSRLVPLIADQKVAVVFVNQLRKNVGVMFGEDEVTSGGMAPKFYAGVRVALRRGKKLKDGEKIIGIGGRMEVVKSKIGTPFKHVNFETFFSSGIDPLSGLLEYLVDRDVISRPTTQSYEFSGERFRTAEFASFWNTHRDAILVKLSLAEGTTILPENPEEVEEDKRGEKIKRQGPKRRD